MHGSRKGRGESKRIACTTTRPIRPLPGQLCAREGVKRDEKLNEHPAVRTFSTEKKSDYVPMEREKFLERSGVIIPDVGKGSYYRLKNRKVRAWSRALPEERKEEPQGEHIYYKQVATGIKLSPPMAKAKQKENGAVRLRPQREKTRCSSERLKEKKITLKEEEPMN